jgi:hypothetical protein
MAGKEDTEPIGLGFHLFIGFLAVTRLLAHPGSPLLAYRCPNKGHLDGRPLSSDPLALRGPLNRLVAGDSPLRALGSDPGQPF